MKRKGWVSERSLIFSFSFFFSWKNMSIVQPQQYTIAENLKYEENVEKMAFRAGQRLILAWKTKTIGGKKSGDERENSEAFVEEFPPQIALLSCISSVCRNRTVNLFAYETKKKKSTAPSGEAEAKNGRERVRKNKWKRGLLRPGRSGRARNG